MNIFFIVNQLSIERESRERDGGGGNGLSRRAASGNKGRGGYFHNLEKITTSFFFTNFPGYFNISDLWKDFGRFGKVGEVFVPRKIGRWGGVQFKEVSNVADLERRSGWERGD